MSEPVLAELDAVRARRHPLLVAIAWAWFALLGWVAAAPFHGVARHIYGRHPRADRALFAPGAYDLLELLLKSEGALAGALTSTAWLVVLVSLAGHVPLAMAMIQLAFREDARRWLPLPTLTSRALAVFLRFLGVWAAGLVAKGAIVLLGVWLGSVLARNRAEAWGWARAEQAGLAVVALFVAGAIVIHVVEDLARADIVARDARLPASVGAAIAAVKIRRGAPVVAWAWRTLAGALAVVAALVVVPALPDGALGTLLAVLIHQSAVALRVGLRASWLCVALRASISRTERAAALSPP